MPNQDAAIRCLCFLAKASVTRFGLVGGAADGRGAGRSNLLLEQTRVIVGHNSFLAVENALHHYRVKANDAPIRTMMKSRGFGRFD